LVKQPKSAVFLIYDGISITIKDSEKIMAIAKVVEVNSSSSKSFEDAIQTGIAKVTETVKNVQGAWINEQKVVIRDNQITEYRVNLKISFLVE
jgi:flavin-binding protein dodecin